MPVRVTLTTGETIDADHVVVTVSAGVLKAEADAMFSPPLPAAKSAAIRDIGRKARASSAYSSVIASGFDAIGKVFFTFDAAFWPSELGYIYLIERLPGAREPVAEAQAAF